MVVARNEFRSRGLVLCTYIIFKSPQFMRAFFVLGLFENAFLNPERGLLEEKNDRLGK